MIKRFTGWHMLGIMVLMFGTILTVNFVMASGAIRTFGGVVVENSYVASQRYNGWLDAGRAQEAAGWKAQPLVSDDGELTLLVQRAGETVTGAKVTVLASHPLGRLPERELDLRWNGDRGVYEAAQKLPEGRWKLRIDVDAGGAPARFADEVRI